MTTTSRLPPLKGDSMFDMFWSFFLVLWADAGCNADPHGGLTPTTDAGCHADPHGGDCGSGI